jgi:hypothetical protein
MSLAVTVTQEFGYNPTNFAARQMPDHDHGHGHLGHRPGGVNIPRFGLQIRW